MPNKLDVYNLGQLGINRVKSPIQVQDGELLNAQNASVRPVMGQLALSKRDGMVEINDDAANGTLLHIHNIPIRTLGGRPSCVVTPDIPSGNWYRGCWSAELDLFVVIEFGGSGIITSPDGETWTARTSPASTSWRDITYSPELTKFVAVGINNAGASTQVMTSLDGITWTNQTAATNRSWDSVAWSPALSLFVAHASSGVAAGMAMSSPDGITWTSRNLPALRPARKIVWADSLGLFVGAAEVGGGVTDNITTSSDGITWTVVNTGIVGGWNCIAWSEELGMLVTTGFTVLPFGLPKSIYSTDGVNWVAGNLPTASPSLSEIAWNPELGVFLHAYGQDSLHMSSDGINWQALGANCGQSSVTGVVPSPELLAFLTLGRAGTPVFELVSVS